MIWCVCIFFLGGGVGYDISATVRPMGVIVCMTLELCPILVAIS